MANYQIEFAKAARKELDKLSDSIAIRLIEAIKSLSSDPRPNGHKKLKGRDAFRIRVGDYRVIYHIFDKILTVEIIAVGHRRDIYE